MNAPPPSAGSEHIRNITKDIILTILTCGLFNLYVQQRQMLAINVLLKEEKYKFWTWFLLTLVTCGIYHIYHEYRKSSDLAAVMKDQSPNEPLVVILLLIFGLFFVADAIQQSHINRHFGVTKL